MLRLIVITSFLYGSLADPPCPKVESDNFDFVEHATGKWYSAAMYDNIIHKGVNCIMVEYADKYDNGSVKYYNSHLENGKVITWSGLNMAADDGESDFITNNFNSDEAILIPLNVLKTDVDKYAICYKCVYDENTKIRTEFVWIISRTRILSRDVKLIIDDYMNNSPLIDAKHLIWEDFTEEQCEPVDRLTFN